ncbi:MAG: YncE family protein [Bryobacteraceae bacterium]
MSVQITILNMASRPSFRSKILLFSFVSSWAAVASGQKAAFVIGEKVSGSVGFYDADGHRLGGAKVGSHPHEIVLSPDKQTLYVADNGVLWMTETTMGENTVSIVDIPGRKTIGKIDLGEFHRPHGITFDAPLNRLLVSTEKPSQLLSIEPSTKKIVQKYDVGGTAPHIVKVGSQPGIAFVTNTDTGTLAFIDLKSGTRKVVPCGERPQGQALSPDTKMLYVANSGGASISIFDVDRQERVGTIPAAKAPVRLVVTPDNKTLIYAAQEGRSVGFVDLKTRKEIATVPLSGRPVSMSLSLDGKLAYSSVQEQDKIYVLSVSQRTTQRVFETPKGTGPDPVVPLF